MGSMEIESPERRWFLRTAPVAAVAGLALGDAALLATPGTAQPDAAQAFELFRSSQLDGDIHALQADPGQKSLYACATFSVVLQSETAKSGAEFEWHEHRDHIFHILDGETIYELGGKPQHAHSPKPGEWLAPSSEGTTAVHLNKGDVLVIRRGTPHKRITKKSVTLTLIAPMTT